MVSLECLQFGDTCWLGPGPLKPHPCSPLEPPHFPGAPHFPHVTRRLFLWQVLDKIMLSDFIFFSPMYRFFSVAVTALVSPPTSLAPQGYSPPNVMEILVAHIYGAFPYVPGTVVALTSTVRRAVPLFYGWGSRGTLGWCTLVKVISPACGVCDGSILVPFTASRSRLRPVRGLLGGYYSRRLCRGPPHLGLLHGLHAGVHLGLHALLVLVQLELHPLQVLHVLG